MNQNELWEYIEGAQANALAAAEKIKEWEEETHKEIETSRGERAIDRQ